MTFKMKYTSIAALTLMQAALCQDFYPAYETPNPDIDVSVVAIADLNNDGRKDIVAGAEGDRIMIYYQNQFDQLGTAVSYNTLTSPKSIKVSDINNDGRQDIIMCIGGDRLEILEQDYSGEFLSTQVISTNIEEFVEVGYFGPDSLIDIATIGWGEKKVEVYNNSEYGFVLDSTYQANYAGYNDLAVGDVNNDGLTDIVVASGQGFVDNLSFITQNEDGSFAPAEVILGPDDRRSVKGLAVGDVTGDNKDDIIIAFGGNRPGSQLRVYVQGENGTFDSTVQYNSYDIPEPVELGDANRDGLLDVFVVHGGWNRVGVYLQKEDGTLEDEQLYKIPYASHYSRQGLAVGDFNSDGSDDIAIGDYNHGLVTLTNAISSIYASYISSVQSGETPLRVDFDATTSNTPDSGDLMFRWDFGNGDTASGQFTNYTFTEGGEFEVKLVVENSAGEKDSVIHTISVEKVNTAPVVEPIDDKIATINRKLSFNVSAHDAEDDPLFGRVVNLPEGALFDSTNGAFSWTPTTSGTFENILIIVSDGELEDSASFSITVELSAPKITQVSGDVTVTEGEDAIISVTASGEELSYQWYKNEKIIESANSPILQISEVSLQDNGAQYFCVVSNPAGSVQSTTATLTVNPSVVTYPQWDPNQAWYTYSVGDKRTNSNRNWECINIAYSYLEPSSSHGHFGWKELK